MGHIEAGAFTATANGALTKGQVVKITSGTTTDPVQVEASGLGEQSIGTVTKDTASGALVPVRLWSSHGTHEAQVAGACARGADLYGAASGQLNDVSSGTAVAKALEAATAANDIIEVMPFTVISTTAATVSVADSGSLITAATVEAALAEAFTHIQSAQQFVPIPLTSWMLGDGTNTVSFGGPATDPVLDMTNGDTDSALRYTWAAASVVPIITQLPLPPNLNTSANLVLHLRTAKDADANTVTIASDAYFNEGDTKVEDVTATIAQAAGETTITIAAADVPAGAQTLTLELTPSAHAGDALYLYATWLEYTGTTLTA